MSFIASCYKVQRKQERQPEQVEVDTWWVRLWFRLLPARDKQSNLLPHSSVCAEAGKMVVSSRVDDLWLAAGQVAATGLH